MYCIIHRLVCGLVAYKWKMIENSYYSTYSAHMPIFGSGKLHKSLLLDDKIIGYGSWKKIAAICKESRLGNDLMQNMSYLQQTDILMISISKFSKPNF